MIARASIMLLVFMGAVSAAWWVTSGFRVFTCSLGG